MSTPLRVGAFVAGLLVLFGAAFGAGRLFEGQPAAATSHPHDGGYRFVLGTAPAGTLAFTLQDEHGAVLTDFDVKHEKKLHLIAVDTGYSGYRHLHPSMAADGTWTTPFRAVPGRTQLYADFRPAGGEDEVARAHLDATGPLGSPAYTLLRSVDVDGYRVTALGDLEAGVTSDLRFEIGRDGVGVTDLQPYLGAYGHLVVLRESDGAFQHVHPADGPAGPVVSFAAEVPSAGRYHLYVDFRHGGVVRTAHLVLDAARAARPDEEVSHGDH